jgi:hypothetical protein
MDKLLTSFDENDLVLDFLAHLVECKKSGPSKQTILAVDLCLACKLELLERPISVETLIEGADGFDLLLKLRHLSDLLGCFNLL